MDETPKKDGLVAQLKSLIADTFEYLNSLLSLQQAKFTAFFLSAVLFVLQIAFSALLVVAAFILFNVALGIGLSRLFGSNLWAVLCLGGLYVILAIVFSFRALRWFKRLKS